MSSPSRAWSCSEARGLSFRPVTAEDADFLRALYASTRAEELKPVPWTDAEKAEFLRQQFEAQDRHYRSHFERAEYLVITCAGRPVGRVYLDRRPDEVRVIDIAISPDRRGDGLGTAVMEDVLEDAAGSGRAVRIHVEHLNPAMRLYERLGFKPVDDQGVYVLMEWRSPETAVDARAP